MTSEDRPRYMNGGGGRVATNGGGVPADPPATPNKPLIIDLQIVRPQEGSTHVGPWSGVTVVVEGSATVTSGTGAIERVDVKVGPNPFAAATPKGGSWSSWTASQLVTVAATIQVTARAIVNGQVLKERSATITTALQPKPVEPAPPPPDTTPPAVAIVSPKPRTSLVMTGSQATLAIAGTASDVGSGIDKVELTVDGLPVTPSQVSRSWNNWTAQAILTSLGKHVISARATDKAGLQTTAVVEVVAISTPARPPVVEKLFLVERCRLSSYLGAYGPGRTIKTLSLLPGEKTTIAVKSYKRTAETATESSSVLDSTTSESESDFENALAREQSNRQAVEESSSWHAEAKVGAAWGWGSASISGGAAGASNAAREQLARSVANAVQKHAAKAAAKREVDVKSSREMKREEGEEFSSESQVANINLSRTLNFVFRQMNQEYLTILHLVDVRVAYVRGDLVDEEGRQSIKYTYREATLSQLDGLLQMVIVPEARDEVRGALMQLLSNVFDYQDEPHRMVEENTLVDVDGKPIPNGSYLRVPKITSVYEDEATGTEIRVPGVILAVLRNVLPTDGVACDAFLGLGEALDEYSTGLQREAILTRQLENERQRGALQKEQLALKIVETGDSEAARRYSEVYPIPETESLALVTSATGNGGPE